MRTGNERDNRVMVTLRMKMRVAGTVHCDLDPALADEVTVLTSGKSRLKRLVKSSLSHSEESLQCTTLC